MVGIGWEWVFERGSVRELRLEAKSSIVNVKIDRDGGCNVFCDAIRQRFVIGLWNPCWLELAPNPTLVGAIEVEYGAENFPQLLGRDVSSACDNSPFIVQESGSGPASHIVTTIDIRSLVSVNSDRNEVLVDQVDDCLIRIGRVVHDVAPVTPRTRDV